MKIRNETEQRLMTAVEKAVDHVRGGDHPTQAIVKAAREFQIPPGGVLKLAHAYNNACVNRQRQDHQGVSEKIADVVLADASEALETIYPDRVKTAAAAHHDNAISADYSTTPAGMLQRREGERRGKAAQLARPQTAAVPRRDARTDIQRAYGQAATFQRQTEESRRKVSKAMDDMGEVFCRISKLARTATCPPLDIVRRNVDIMHGDDAVRVIDSITEVSPDLLKLAHHRRPSPAVWQKAAAAPVTHPIYAGVADFLAKTATYQRLRDAHAQVKEANAAAAAAVLLPVQPRPRSIFDAVRPAAAPTDSDSEGGHKEAAMPSLFSTVGGIALAKGMFDGIAHDMKAPDQDALVNKALNKLTDPEHEAQLRGINTQATLQDFILNDPVISGHDPQDVMDAFNDITQLAPSVSDQRMALQALLRKRLQQGNMDTFDVDQILKLEQGLRQRNLIVRPKGEAPHA